MGVMDLMDEMDCMDAVSVHHVHIVHSRRLRGNDELYAKWHFGHSLTTNQGRDETGTSLTLSSSIVTTR